MATAIAICMNQLGLVAGFAWPPLAVPDFSDCDALGAALGSTSRVYTLQQNYL